MHLKPILLLSLAIITSSLVQGKSDSTFLNSQTKGLKVVNQPIMLDNFSFEFEERELNPNIQFFWENDRHRVEAELSKFSRAQNATDEFDEMIYTLSATLSYKQFLKTFSQQGIKIYYVVEHEPIIDRFVRKTKISTAVPLRTQWIGILLRGGVGASKNIGQHFFADLEFAPIQHFYGWYKEMNFTEPPVSGFVFDQNLSPRMLEVGAGYRF